ncbi:MAG: ABC transporter permease subunit [Acidimicrobiia bacterium]|nr:ABC transporter permease subunit [Acidimicrobiia bacterium]
MALLEFWRSHANEFGQLLRQHTALVLVSTALAALVGIPLGVLAARRPRLGQAVLTVVSVAQTIPSLALLGFLLPLPLVGGVGPRTALVALFLYALLPIVRNTTTGLLQVDRAAREAAVAVGMTSWQRLRMVELPLALPSVMTGLRLAAVIGVGTATVAAAVGAGGLGEYIFRGLAMVDATMILAGAIPAALVALVADAVLARVEWHLTRRRGRSSRAALVTVFLATAALVAVVAGGRRHADTIIVASKNTTEQVLLGEIVAQLIEAEATRVRSAGGPAAPGAPASRSDGVQVRRRLNLGGTFVCDAGLRSGAIDVYVEYTGTSLSAIFREPVSRDSVEVLARVREKYASAGVSVLQPLGFNNTFAILVRGEDARRNGWRTIDDLPAYASTLRPGFGHEFLERADGYRGLVQTYGLQFVNQPRGMELSLIYRALADGEVDLIAGDATSALIDRLDLFPLADTKRYFPPYDAVPVARSAMLLRHPEIGRALARLAGRITDADMRALNAAVDIEKQDPRAVAERFVSMFSH